MFCFHRISDFPGEDFSIMLNTSFLPLFPQTKASEGAFAIKAVVTVSLSLKEYSVPGHKNFENLLLESDLVWTAPIYK